MIGMVIRVFSRAYVSVSSVTDHIFIVPDALLNELY